jgi:hypothetical protein
MMEGLEWRRRQSDAFQEMRFMAKLNAIALLSLAFILVACFLPVMAQGSETATITTQTGLSDQTVSLPGTNTSIPLAVGRSLNGLSDIVCEQNRLGKLKGLDQTEVPDSLPLADELQYLAERALQNLFDVDSKSLTYLLFHSGMPSDTGDGNPFVAHTKGSHGTLANGQNNLPSSREMDLAIKVLQSSGNLAPKDLMKMSLEVTGGDVPSALLTCHNFLKEITWAQREGFSPTFLSFTPKGSSQEPENVADSTIDINTKAETKSEKKARAETLRKEYIKSFKNINDNFVVINNNGHLTISLGSEDASLISDRLMNLRPADDATNDKMGPWYHTFGVLFLGSTAAGGESTAKLWAEGEGLMRHYMPGFSSKPDAFKESLTNSAADEIGAILDCLNEKPSPGSTEDSSRESLGWIMGTKGAFVSRGNIVGGTDHLGFANCLCRCGCSQAGWACGAGVACVYDANPKGECLCAGYGEGHVPVLSSGECYDGCAKEYHITGMLSNKTPLVPANSGGSSAIMPGDLIQTTGATVIRLKDGSKLLVKAGSILKFTSTQSGNVRVNLLSGFLRTVYPGGGPAGAGGPEVQIANATVQPKGTEFVCQWDGSSGKVSVVEGSVSVADEALDETIDAGKEMALPARTLGDYNLSADDGGLVAGIPLRELILDDGEPEPFGEYDPDFEGGKIPDDWAWQDPGSDAKLDSSSSGGLMVTVPDGNEFWGYPGVTAGQRSEAPRCCIKSQATSICRDGHILILRPLTWPLLNSCTTLLDHTLA